MGPDLENMVDVVRRYMQGVPVSVIVSLLLSGSHWSSRSWRAHCPRRRSHPINRMPSMYSVFNNVLQ
jgi:hypothetical protein